MPDKPETPTLRMARVLHELALELHGFSELARSIKAANNNHPKRRVERRKLARIAAGEDVSLTLDELRALDTYLTPLGEGLADRPLFDKPNPILALAGTGAVTLVLGAYPRDQERRIDLSWWDVRSMTHLLRAIALRRPGTDVEIQDLLVEEDQPVPFYLQDPRRSVCAIGSPRASFATEYMLAEMFEVRPFDDRHFDRVKIHFLWPWWIKPFCSSAFSPDPESLARFNPDLWNDLGGANRDQPVLEVNGKRYEDTSPKNEGEPPGQSFGMVITQQQADGGVWMVLAGLTGPATYACATAVTSGVAGTVLESGDRPSPVRWDLVSTVVERNPVPHGDPRTTDTASVVDSGIVELH
jgi:hypothetical protein